MKTQRAPTPNKIQKQILNEFSQEEIGKYWAKYKIIAKLSGTYPKGSDKHFLQFIRMEIKK